MLFKLKALIIKMLASKDEIKGLSIYDEIKEGDSVYAKMPLRKGELKKIAKDHQIRPYVVLKKKRYSFIGFQCSSTFIPKGPHYLYHKIRYSIEDKDSYINLSKIYEVPILNIRSYFKHIKAQDLAIINKKLDMVNKRSFVSDLRFEDIDSSPSIGDVIKIGQNTYYVYRVYAYDLNIIKTVNYRPRHYFDLKNNFFLDLDDMRSIKRPQRIEYVGMYGQGFNQMIDDVLKTYKIPKRFV